ncbi:hypothetical protein EB796_004895 [Bugula neritina]|uniref:Uncharacterized protein n=1 Tax=Bugula neritina TaxID=10212 RepID=A0A7J7KDR7_BUGNE|nr:hypothetical protein EB796_004895 [Bugula neritina]
MVASNDSEGYKLFAQLYKRKRERDGRRKLEKKEFDGKAALHWRALTSEQKKRYGNEADRRTNIASATEKVVVSRKQLQSREPSSSRTSYRSRTPKRSRGHRHYSSSRSPSTSSARTEYLGDSASSSSDSSYTNTTACTYYDEYDYSDATSCSSIATSYGDYTETSYKPHPSPKAKPVKTKKVAEKKTVAVKVAKPKTTIRKNAKGTASTSKSRKSKIAKVKKTISTTAVVKRTKNTTAKASKSAIKSTKVTGTTAKSTSTVKKNARVKSPRKPRRLTQRKTATKRKSSAPAKLEGAGNEENKPSSRKRARVARSTTRVTRSTFKAKTACKPSALVSKKTIPLKKTPATLSVNIKKLQVPVVPCTMNPPPQNWSDDNLKKTSSDTEKNEEVGEATTATGASVAVV